MVSSQEQETEQCPVKTQAQSEDGHVMTQAEARAAPEPHVVGEGKSPPGMFLPEGTKFNYQFMETDQI